MAWSPTSPSPEVSLVFGACTDIGRVRKENQDRWGAFPPVRPSLFVVADGMGGHADGGVASRLAVAALAEGFRQQGESPQGGGLEDRLREAVAAANTAVWHEANRGRSHRRMGTTCTVLAVEGGGPRWRTWRTAGPTASSRAPSSSSPRTTRSPPSWRRAGCSVRPRLGGTHNVTPSRGRSE
jgi:serine/threonine protein phosphatase PrpC